MYTLYSTLHTIILDNVADCLTGLGVGTYRAKMGTNINNLHVQTKSACRRVHYIVLFRLDTQASTGDRAYPHCVAPSAVPHHRFASLRCAPFSPMYIYLYVLLPPPSVCGARARLSTHPSLPLSVAGKHYALRIIDLCSLWLCSEEHGVSLKRVSAHHEHTSDFMLILWVGVF